MSTENILSSLLGISGIFKTEHLYNGNEPDAGGSSMTSSEPTPSKEEIELIVQLNPARLTFTDRKGSETIRHILVDGQLSLYDICSECKLVMSSRGGHVYRHMKKCGGGRLSTPSTPKPGNSNSTENNGDQQQTRPPQPKQQQQQQTQQQQTTSQPTTIAALKESTLQYRRLSDSQIDQITQMFANFVVESGMSYDMIENPAFRKIVVSLINFGTKAGGSNVILPPSATLPSSSAVEEAANRIRSRRPLKRTLDAILQDLR